MAHRRIPPISSATAGGCACANVTPTGENSSERNQFRRSSAEATRRRGKHSLGRPPMCEHAVRDVAGSPHVASSVRCWSVEERTAAYAAAYPLPRVELKDASAPPSSWSASRTRYDRACALGWAAPARGIRGVRSRDFPAAHQAHRMLGSLGAGSTAGACASRAVQSGGRSSWR